MAVIRGRSISSFGQMFPSISGAGEAVVVGKVWLSINQENILDSSFDTNWLEEPKAMILGRFPYTFPILLSPSTLLRARQDEKLGVSEDEKLEVRE